MPVGPEAFFIGECAKKGTFSGTSADTAVTSYFADSIWVRE